jgi:hypothetical protein
MRGKSLDSVAMKMRHVRKKALVMRKRSDEVSFRSALLFSSHKGQERHPARRLSRKLLLLQRALA